MARYFRLPFGVSGDKATIPDPEDTTDGTVSYTQGYGPNYALNPSSDTDALNVERLMFNQLAFDITSTLQLYYQTGVPPFITTADNGGSAYSYSRGARVRINNRIYETTTDGNTNVPPDSGWELVDLTGLDLRFARLSQNLNDIPNKNTARSNLELGTAATADTGTGASNLPTTSQADSRYLQRSNDLSDLGSAITARVNLDLGTVATLDTGTDGGNVPTITLADARYYTQTAADSEFYSRALADGRFLQQSNNLSDLDSISTARNNLDLGTAATRDVGTDDNELMEVGAFGLGVVQGRLLDLNIPLSDTQTGFNAYSSGSSNKPENSNGTLLTITRDIGQNASPAKSQITLTQNNNLFFRVLNSSNYQPWQRVLRSSENLSDIDDSVTARTNLGLGSAATRDVGDSDNNLMEVGAFGLGRIPQQIQDLNFPVTDERTLITQYNNSGLQNGPEDAGGTLLTITRSTNPTFLQAKSQLTINSNDNLWFRSLNQNNYLPWKKVITADRNLADLDNTASARTNLGLTSAATTNVGTSQGDLSLISNNGFGGFTLTDQDDSSSEFSTPDDINRNGLFYFTNAGGDDDFPGSGDWFIFSMVHGSSSSDSDSGVKSQFAVGAGRKVTENVWVRGQNRSENTWTDWESVIALPVMFLNWGFGQFFSNFMNGNFFPGMY